MTRPSGSPNPLHEIAEILVDGYIILRSQEDSPPDRQESPGKGQNVDSQSTNELNDVRPRGMDAASEASHQSKPSKDLN